MQETFFCKQNLLNIIFFSLCFAKQPFFMQNGLNKWKPSMSFLTYENVFGKKERNWSKGENRDFLNEKS